MAEIDEVIAAHGGWPGAFTTESKESVETSEMPVPKEDRPPDPTEEKPSVEIEAAKAPMACTGELPLDIEGELSFHRETREVREFDDIYTMTLVRDWFEQNGPSEREVAAKGLIYSLGYGRSSDRLMQEAHNVLLTAVKRGVLINENGILSLLCRKIENYRRDFLKNQFLAAIGRAWISRDDAIQEFARWLGYSRTGPVIDQTARSLINGLIREGRLETDGAESIRRAP